MPATISPEAITQAAVIRTPGQRVRVFASSTLQELAAGRTGRRDPAPVRSLYARPSPPYFGRGKRHRSEPR